MTNKFSKTPLAAAIGTLVAVSFSSGAAATPVEGENPFALRELPSGYQQLAQQSEEQSAEGTAGEEKKATGEEDEKKVEGKCGEGKCGEGKCGGLKKKEGAGDEKSD